MPTYANPTFAGDYQSLCDTIADTLNRADLTTSIPNFVSLATARIQRDIARVRHPSGVSKAIATFTNAYAPLPLDWLANYQLMTETAIVDYVAPHASSALLNARPSASAAMFYTIIGKEMRLFPTPAAGSPVSLTLWYYAYLPTLSDTNTTNWVLQRYPDLYLYGALAHSAPYLKADDRIPTWEGIYQKLLSEIEIEADRATRSQTHVNASARPF